MGAQFDQTRQIYRNDVNIYSSEQPLNVTEGYWNDKVQHEAIIEFFELIELQVTLQ